MGLEPHSHNHLFGLSFLVLVRSVIILQHWSYIFTVALTILFKSFWMALLEYCWGFAGISHLWFFCTLGFDYWWYFHEYILQNFFWGKVLNPINFLWCSLSNKEIMVIGLSYILINFQPFGDRRVEVEANELGWRVRLWVQDPLLVCVVTNQLKKIKKKCRSWTIFSFVRMKHFVHVSMF